MNNYHSELDHHNPEYDPEGYAGRLVEIDYVEEEYPDKHLTLLSDTFYTFSKSKKIEVRYERGEGLENLVKVNGRLKYAPF